MAEASPGEKLRELRGKYITGLPDRMGELRDSWNRLQHVSWDPKALAFMDRCAHKLHGSGATFQLPDISDTARVLEEQLTTLREKPTATERQHIEDSLKALERAIKQACGVSAKSEAPVAAPKTVMEKNHPYRIVVIEDDANQAAHLKNWLELQGYCAETFEDPDTYNRRTDGQLIAARINLVSQRKESRSLQNHDYFLTELGDLLAGMERDQEAHVHYLVQVSIDRQEYLRAQHGARAMAGLSARMENGDTLFEALVRLVDGDNAVYLPGQFLSRLPEGHRGPFYELDRWVIQHAIESLTHLEGKASASHSVSIKLSSPMVDVEHLLTVLSASIRDNRIKGNRRIYLALSSPTVLKDVPRAKKIAQLVQSMGCGLIIEHVATDTASVELLKELDSVDFVKLSPTFGASAQQTLALEQRLNQLKATLNFSRRIVVSGVEDAKALSWFWKRGIRNFQGYFIQEPKVAMNYAL